MLFYIQTNHIYNIWIGISFASQQIHCFVNSFFPEHCQH